VNPGPLAIHGGVAPSVQIYDIGFRWLQTEKNAGCTNHFFAFFLARYGVTVLGLTPTPSTL